MRADFDKAFNATMGHEGGYANDPSDFGGETYRGIARRFHPGWQGWQTINNAKLICSEPGDLSRSEVAVLFDELDPLVREFYRLEFWLKVGGDRVSTQAVANELFDTAVNMSPGRAVEFLQVALNALNRSDRGDRRYFEDVVEDGDIGPRTLDALAIYLVADPDRYLLTLLNVQQGAFYLERMRKIPSQERFARGWLKRVELVRSRGEGVTS